jgi:hypothetical protein
VLVKKAVFVQVGLLNEFQNIVVADIDVQVLVKHCFDFVDAHESLFLSVEEREHIQGFLLSPPPEEPLLGDEFHHFTQRKGLLVLVGTRNFILDFLSVHLGVCEIAQNASEILTKYVARIGGVIEGKGVFDLIFLNESLITMSSESLLLRLLVFDPLLFVVFFFNGFISYKYIYSFK